MFEKKCDYIYIIKGDNSSDNNLPPMCAAHNKVPLPVFCGDNLI